MAEIYFETDVKHCFLNLLPNKIVFEQPFPPFSQNVFDPITERNGHVSNI